MAPSAHPRIPEIRTVMFPRDINHMGSIFGGHILSLLDLAAAQFAHSFSARKYVTKVMREVNFISPVYVGDRVSFYCTLRHVGTTSLTIRVDVEAFRGIRSSKIIKVTSAEVVMVAVDDNFHPVPVLDRPRKKKRGKKRNVENA